MLFSALTDEDKAQQERDELVDRGYYDRHARRDLTSLGYDSTGLLDRVLLQLVLHSDPAWVVLQCPFDGQVRILDRDVIGVLARFELAAREGNRLTLRVLC